MNILLVHAQPEKTSLTHHLVNMAQELLTAQGHTIIQSDLYAMGWKAVFDGDDFPARINTERLSFIEESKHAFTHSRCRTGTTQGPGRRCGYLSFSALVVQHARDYERLDRASVGVWPGIRV